MGLRKQDKIHGLGDGAKWIEAQMKRVFLSQIKYLVDFYHVSEYLSAAAEHSWTSEKEAWRKESQKLLKESKIDEVLEELGSGCLWIGKKGRQRKQKKLLQKSAIVI
jgi:hypothetical protein